MQTRLQIRLQIRLQTFACASVKQIANQKNIANKTNKLTHIQTKQPYTHTHTHTHTHTQHTQIHTERDTLIIK